MNHWIILILIGVLILIWSVAVVPAVSAQSCHNRVEMLERQLRATQQQLRYAQEQLQRERQRSAYPNYRPYSSPYGYGQQGPLGQTNQTLRQWEELQRTWERLTD